MSDNITVIESDIVSDIIVDVAPEELKTVIVDAVEAPTTVIVSNAAGADGATGPTGPAGPAGPAGTNGTNGTNGIDGHSPVLTWVSDQIAIDGVTSGPHLTGPTGAAGADGPNLVSTSTSTNITGIIKGTGSAIVAASAGSDYVAPNVAISGATKTKITYDAKGLVTAGADATTADIADSTDKRYCTDAQKVVIGNTSGTNTGDQNLSGLVPYTGATGDVTLGSHNLSITGYEDFVAIANPAAPSAGIARFHAATTQGFTRFEQDNEAATNLVLGRDNVIIAKNTTVSQINKGQVVYITGSTGNVPNIGLAKADSTTTLPAIGVALDDISANAFGQVMGVGIISGINTSSFNSGDVLWVDASTAGALTKTRPAYPNFAQRIGSVLVSGVGNGSIDITVAPFIGGMDTGTNGNFTAAGTITGSNLSGTNTGDQTSVSGSSGSCTGNSATVTGLSVTAGKTLTVSDSATIANAAVTLANTKVLTLTGSLTASADATVSGTNTGDQTLPVKCAGSDITTGTEDTKFATSKAIRDAGYYSPIPVDHTADSVDYALHPGESIYLTFSSATSVPLHIATVDGAEYEISINTTSLAANPTNGAGFLQPNNTTYTNAFKRQFNTGTGTTVSTSLTTESAFLTNANGLIKSIIRAVTTTLGKCITMTIAYKNNDGSFTTANGMSYWVDTTTAWTSLGTLTLPAAQTGKIIITRMV